MYHETHICYPTFASITKIIACHKCWIIITCAVLYCDCVMHFERIIVYTCRRLISKNISCPFAICSVKNESRKFMVFVQCVCMCVCVCVSVSNKTIICFVNWWIHIEMDLFEKVRSPLCQQRITRIEVTWFCFTHICVLPFLISSHLISSYICYR